MSRAFGLILKTRERLYRLGVFQASRLDHPVISVGNLTLGGTGKTPLVIALAERLRDDGFSPVVLSRGYKRTSTGVLVVSRGEGPIVKWAEAGDEPFLIARRVHGLEWTPNRLQHRPPAGQEDRASMEGHGLVARPLLNRDL